MRTLSYRKSEPPASLVVVLTLHSSEATKPTTSGREIDTTNLDDVGSNVPYAGPPLSERANQSPCDDSPSRRKKLITGLRSFKSLRSLRSSPGKVKNADKNCDKSASPLEVHFFSNLDTYLADHSLAESMHPNSSHHAVPHAHFRGVSTNRTLF